MLQNFLLKNWTHAPNLNPRKNLPWCKEKLREKYVQAEIGVTGANFIIAILVASQLQKMKEMPGLVAPFLKHILLLPELKKLFLH